MSTDKDGLLFGIYPGGVAGTDTGELASGPTDEPDHIIAALKQLQGRNGHPLLVRAYLTFTAPTEHGAQHPTQTPADAVQYTGDGRSLDLVAQYQSRHGDIAGYCAFLHDLVAQYGAVTSTLQVTEEPNVTTNPVLDGYYPGASEAITTGVSTVKREARRLGHHHLRVGVNTTPLFGPSTSFFTDLVRTGGFSFINDLDYVGLDFFPDVFHPVPDDELADATEGLLRHHRDNVLGPAGLGDHPLHITEHGWPTGPDRSPARQAHVVETVIRTIDSTRSALNLSGYTHFALRDADSTQPGLFHRFGITTEDYAPKPAFETYRQLIDRLSTDRRSA